MGWNSYFDAPLLQQLLTSAGIPATDNPTLLYSGGATLNDGFTFQTPEIDISKWASLFVSVYELNNNYAGTVCRTVIINYTPDTVGSRPILQDTGVWMVGGPPSFGSGVVPPYQWHYRAPAVGKGFWLNFGSVIIGQSSQLNVEIWGTYRLFPRWVQMIPGVLGSSTATVKGDIYGSHWDMSLAAAATDSTYISSYWGNATWHYGTGNSANAFDYGIIDVVNGGYWARRLTTADAVRADIPIVLPSSPILVQTKNLNAGASAAYQGLTMTGGI